MWNVRSSGGDQMRPADCRGVRVGLALLCAVVSGVHSGAAGNDGRLIDAVTYGDRKAVVELLRQKADVNVRQPDGATALHSAVERDDAAIVDLLVRHGADVNAANDYGVTPISLAATNGSPAIVKTLLTRGADVNAATVNGETPLMTAARTGSVPVVTLLLAHGAKVESKESSHGQTALMWALSEGHFDVAEVLVERGADVHAGSQSGFTPLMFAARTGDLGVSRLLLSRGAEINAAAADGSTPLLVAVVRGHVDLAKLFLDNGADPNLSQAGFTPLHWTVGRWENISSVNHRWPEGKEGDEWRVMAGVPARKVELVQSLLDHGANVNAVTTQDPPRFGAYQFYGGSIGATPLFYAAWSGDADMMRLLLARGADPTIATKDSVTVLQAAAGYGRWGVSEETTMTEDMAIAAVRVALEVGNDINTADVLGETSLHHATGANMPDVVRFLVAHGAQLNVENKNTATPLAAALGRRCKARANVCTVEERPTVAAVLRELGAAEDEGGLAFTVDSASASKDGVR